MLEETGLWPSIIVYGVAWCRDSTRTRRFLNRHHVPYTLIDVEEDPRSAEKVRRWNRGFLSTPTLDIEGQIVTEPSDDELAALVGIRE